MIQANTWQRLAVGQALTHEKLNLDQYIIGAHCMYRSVQ